VKQIQLFHPRNPISTFRNGDV